MRLARLACVSLSAILWLAASATTGAQTPTPQAETATATPGPQQTSTVTATPTPVASVIVIQGEVFHDLDGNGRKDAGEPGLAGWIVSIYQAALFDLEGYSATTDADGRYRLEILMDERTRDLVRIVLMADPPEEPADGHWATTFRTRNFTPITDGIDVPIIAGAHEATFGKVLRAGPQPRVEIDPRPRPGGSVTAPPTGDAGLSGRASPATTGNHIEGKVAVAGSIFAMAVLAAIARRTFFILFFAALVTGILMVSSARYDNPVRAAPTMNPNGGNAAPIQGALKVKDDSVNGRAASYISTMASQWTSAMGSSTWVNVWSNGPIHHWVVDVGSF